MTNIRTFRNATPLIGNEVFIDPTALVIGQVSIGDQTSIWPMVVVRGDIHSITIGSRTNIQDGSILHVTSDSKSSPGGFPLNIGNSVSIGHRAVIHGCLIDHHCLIGIGSIILDGAHLKPYTILGAGSLVPPGKVLEGGFLYYGSPAKQSRPLSENELDQFDTLANHYVELARYHGINGMAASGSGE